MLLCCHHTLRDADFQGGSGVTAHFCIRGNTMHASYRGLGQRWLFVGRLRDDCCTTTTSSCLQTRASRQAQPHPANHAQPTKVWPGEETLEVQNNTQTTACLLDDTGVTKSLQKNRTYTHMCTCCPFCATNRTTNVWQLRNQHVYHNPATIHLNNDSTATTHHTHND
jgi:hypothetical protein